MTPYRIAYIVGSGRCGSTLLDLILAGHPEILALGEVSTLHTVWDPLSDHDDLVERHRDDYRSFWSAVRDRYELSTGQDWDKLTLAHPRWRAMPSFGGEALAGWSERNRAFFDAVHSVEPRPVLTDASKWAQRAHLLAKTPGLDLRVVHLIRDGRAVCHSYVQRYNDFPGGFRTWATDAVTTGMIRRRASVPWLDVKYEDFCREPEQTLKEICAFVGLDFESGLLDRTAPYVGFGGNPNTRKRAQGSVVLDERWRTQMRRRHRVAFALAGGFLNHRYGY